ncbi:hypothetical protein TGGT1_462961 [Toxoplasma gondii GT1]|uniref:UBA domain-containing protein n=1 Tax=Toxoplasma gondii (strain ATCC 50853 / GT1) TaxID=507601 RepID=S7V4B4_TOXGG|nr:hypothetical protein TGGT1_462961 [Toxoplasma gondii GT1]
MPSDLEAHRSPTTRPVSDSVGVSVAACGALAATAAARASGPWGVLASKAAQAGGAREISGLFQALQVRRRRAEGRVQTFDLIHSILKKIHFPLTKAFALRVLRSMGGEVPTPGPLPVSVVVPEAHAPASQATEKSIAATAASSSHKRRFEERGESTKDRRVNVFWQRRYEAPVAAPRFLFFRSYAFGDIREEALGSLDSALEKEEELWPFFAEGKRNRDGNDAFLRSVPAAVLCHRQRSLTDLHYEEDLRGCGIQLEKQVKRSFYRTVALVVAYATGTTDPVPARLLRVSPSFSPLDSFGAPNLSRGSSGGRPQEAEETGGDAQTGDRRSTLGDETADSVTVFSFGSSGTGERRQGGLRSRRRSQAKDREEFRGVISEKNQQTLTESVHAAGAEPQTESAVCQTCSLPERADVVRHEPESIRWGHSPQQPWPFKCSDAGASSGRGDTIRSPVSSSYSPPTGERIPLSHPFWGHPDVAPAAGDGGFSCVRFFLSSACSSFEKARTGLGIEPRKSSRFPEEAHAVWRSPYSPKCVQEIARSVLGLLAWREEDQDALLALGLVDSAMHALLPHRASLRPSPASQESDMEFDEHPEMPVDCAAGTLRERQLFGAPLEEERDTSCGEAKSLAAERRTTGQVSPYSLSVPTNLGEEGTVSHDLLEAQRFVLHYPAVSSALQLCLSVGSFRLQRQALNVLKILLPCMQPDHASRCFASAFAPPSPFGAFVHGPLKRSWRPGIGPQRAWSPSAPTDMQGPLEETLQHRWRTERDTERRGGTGERVSENDKENEGEDGAEEEDKADREEDAEEERAMEDKVLEPWHLRSLSRSHLRQVSNLRPSAVAEQAATSPFANAGIHHPRQHLISSSGFSKDRSPDSGKEAFHRWRLTSGTSTRSHWGSEVSLSALTWTCNSVSPGECGVRGENASEHTALEFVALLLSFVGNCLSVCPLPAVAAAAWQVTLPAMPVSCPETSGKREFSEERERKGEGKELKQEAEARRATSSTLRDFSNKRATESLDPVGDALAEFGVLEEPAESGGTQKKLRKPPPEQSCPSSLWVAPLVLPVGESRGGLAQLEEHLRVTLVQQRQLAAQAWAVCGKAMSHSGGSSSSPLFSATESPPFTPSTSLSDSPETFPSSTSQGPGSSNLATERQAADCSSSRQEGREERSVTSGSSASAGTRDERPRTEEEEGDGSAPLSVNGAFREAPSAATLASAAMLVISILRALLLSPLWEQAVRVRFRESLRLACRLAGKTGGLLNAFERKTCNGEAAEGRRETTPHTGDDRAVDSRERESANDRKELDRGSATGLETQRVESGVEVDAMEREGRTHAESALSDVPSDESLRPFDFPQTMLDERGDSAIRAETTQRLSSRQGAPESCQETPNMSQHQNHTEASKAQKHTTQIRRSFTFHETAFHRRGEDPVDLPSRWVASVSEALGALAVLAGESGEFLRVGGLLSRSREGLEGGGFEAGCSSAFDSAAASSLTRLSPFSCSGVVVRYAPHEGDTLALLREAGGQDRLSPTAASFSRGPCGWGRLSRTPSEVARVSRPPQFVHLQCLDTATWHLAGGSAPQFAERLLAEEADERRHFTRRRTVAGEEWTGGSCGGSQPSLEMPEDFGLFDSVREVHEEGPDRIGALRKAAASGEKRFTRDHQGAGQGPGWPAGDPEGWPRRRGTWSPEKEPFLEEEVRPSMQAILLELAEAAEAAMRLSRTEGQTHSSASTFSLLPPAPFSSAVSSIRRLSPVPPGFDLVCPQGLLSPEGAAALLQRQLRTLVVSALCELLKSPLVVSLLFRKRLLVSLLESLSMHGVFPTGASPSRDARAGASAKPSQTLCDLQRRVLRLRRVARDMLQGTVGVETRLLVKATQALELGGSPFRLLPVLLPTAWSSKCPHGEEATRGEKEDTVVTLSLRAPFRFAGSDWRTLFKSLPEMETKGRQRADGGPSASGRDRCEGCLRVQETLAWMKRSDPSGTQGAGLDPWELNTSSKEAGDNLGKEKEQSVRRAVERITTNQDVCQKGDSAPPSEHLPSTRGVREGSNVAALNENVVSTGEVQSPVRQESDDDLGHTWSQDAVRFLLPSPDVNSDDETDSARERSTPTRRRKPDDSGGGVVWRSLSPSFAGCMYSSEISIVQANRVIPSSLPAYYFEVSVEAFAALHPAPHRLVCVAPSPENPTGVQGDTTSSEDAPSPWRPVRLSLPGCLPSGSLQSQNESAAGTADAGTEDGNGYAHACNDLPHSGCCSGLAIGLFREGVELIGKPGCHGSFAYCSCGVLFHSATAVQEPVGFSAPFGGGDTVGMRWDLKRSSISLFKNGRSLRVFPLPLRQCAAHIDPSNALASASFSSSPSTSFSPSAAASRPRWELRMDWKSIPLGDSRVSGPSRSSPRSFPSTRSSGGTSPSSDEAFFFGSSTSTPFFAGSSPAQISAASAASCVFRDDTGKEESVDPMSKASCILEGSTVAFRGVRGRFRTVLWGFGCSACIVKANFGAAPFLFPFERSLDAEDIQQLPAGSLAIARPCHDSSVRCPGPRDTAEEDPGRDPRGRSEAWRKQSCLRRSRGLTKGEDVVVKGGKERSGHHGRQDKSEDYGTRPSRGKTPTVPTNAPTTGAPSHEPSETCSASFSASVPSTPSSSSFAGSASAPFYSFSSSAPRVLREEELQRRSVAESLHEIMGGGVFPLSLCVQALERTSDDLQLAAEWLLEHGLEELEHLQEQFLREAEAEELQKQVDVDAGEDRGGDAAGSTGNQEEDKRLPASAGVSGRRPKVWKDLSGESGEAQIPGEAEEGPQVDEERIRCRRGDDKGEREKASIEEVRQQGGERDSSGIGIQHEGDDRRGAGRRARARARQEETENEGFSECGEVQAGEDEKCHALDLVRKSEKQRFSANPELARRLEQLAVHFANQPYEYIRYLACLCSSSSPFIRPTLQEISYGLFPPVSERRPSSASRGACLPQAPFASSSWSPAAVHPLFSLSETPEDEASRALLANAFWFDDMLARAFYKGRWSLLVGSPSGPGQAPSGLHTPGAILPPGPHLGLWCVGRDASGAADASAGAAARGGSRVLSLAASASASGRRDARGALSFSPPTTPPSGPANRQSRTGGCVLPVSAEDIHLGMLLQIHPDAASVASDFALLVRRHQEGDQGELHAREGDDVEKSVGGSATHRRRRPSAAGGCEAAQVECLLGAKRHGSEEEAKWGSNLPPVLSALTPEAILPFAGRCGTVWEIEWMEVDGEAAGEMDGHSGTEGMAKEREGNPFTGSTGRDQAFIDSKCESNEVRRSQIPIHPAPALLPESTLESASEPSTVCPAGATDAAQRTVCEASPMRCSLSRCCASSCSPSACRDAAPERGFSVAWPTRFAAPRALLPLEQDVEIALKRRRRQGQETPVEGHSRSRRTPETTVDPHQDEIASAGVLTVVLEIWDEENLWQARRRLVRVPLSRCCRPCSSAQEPWGEEPIEELLGVTPQELIACNGTAAWTSDLLAKVLALLREAEEAVATLQMRHTVLRLLQSAEVQQLSCKNLPSLDRFFSLVKLSFCELGLPLSPAPGAVSTASLLGAALRAWRQAVSPFALPVSSPFFFEEGAVAASRETRAGREESEGGKGAVLLETSRPGTACPVQRTWPMTSPSSTVSPTPSPPQNTERSWRSPLSRFLEFFSSSDFTASLGFVSQFTRSPNCPNGSSPPSTSPPLPLLRTSLKPLLNASLSPTLQHLPESHTRLLLSLLQLLSRFLLHPNPSSESLLLRNIAQEAQEHLTASLAYRLPTTIVDSPHPLGSAGLFTAQMSASLGKLELVHAVSLGPSACKKLIAIFDPRSDIGDSENSKVMSTLAIYRDESLDQEIFSSRSDDAGTRHPGGGKPLAGRILVLDAPKVWVKFTASSSSFSSSSASAFVAEKWGYRILFLPLVHSLSDENAIQRQSPQLAAELSLLTALAASPAEQTTLLPPLLETLLYHCFSPTTLRSAASLFGELLEALHPFPILPSSFSPLAPQFPVHPIDREASRLQRRIFASRSQLSQRGNGGEARPSRAEKQTRTGGRRSAADEGDAELEETSGDRGNPEGTGVVRLQPRTTELLATLDGRDETSGDVRQRASLPSFLPTERRESLALSHPTTSASPQMSGLPLPSSLRPPLLSPLCVSLLLALRLEACSLFTRHFCPMEWSTAGGLTGSSKLISGMTLLAAAGRGGAADASTGRGAASQASSSLSLSPTSSLSSSTASAFPPGHGELSNATTASPRSSPSAAASPPTAASSGAPLWRPECQREAMRTIVDLLCVAHDFVFVHALVERQARRSQVRDKQENEAEREQGRTHGAAEAHEGVEGIGGRTEEQAGAGGVVEHPEERVAQVETNRGSSGERNRNGNDELDDGTVAGSRVEEVVSTSGEADDETDGSFPPVCTFDYFDSFASGAQKHVKDNLNGQEFKLTSETGFSDTSRDPPSVLPPFLDKVHQGPSQRLLSTLRGLLSPSLFALVASFSVPLLPARPVSAVCRRGFCLSSGPLWLLPFCLGDPADSRDCQTGSPASASATKQAGSPRRSASSARSRASPSELLVAFQRSLTFDGNAAFPPALGLPPWTQERDRFRQSEAVACQDVSLSALSSSPSTSSPCATACLRVPAAGQASQPEEGPLSENLSSASLPAPAPRSSSSVLRSPPHPDIPFPRTPTSLAVSLPFLVNLCRVEMQVDRACLGPVDITFVIQGVVSLMGDVCLQLPGSRALWLPLLRRGYRAQARKFTRSFSERDEGGGETETAETRHERQAQDPHSARRQQEGRTDGKRVVSDWKLLSRELTKAEESTGRLSAILGSRFSLAYRVIRSCTGEELGAEFVEFSPGAKVFVSAFPPFWLSRVFTVWDVMRLFSLSRLAALDGEKQHSKKREGQENREGRTFMKQRKTPANKKGKPRREGQRKEEETHVKETRDSRREQKEERAQNAEEENESKEEQENDSREEKKCMEKTRETMGHRLSESRQESREVRCDAHSDNPRTSAKTEDGREPLKTLDFSSDRETPRGTTPGEDKSASSAKSGSLATTAGGKGPESKREADAATGRNTRRLESEREAKDGRLREEPTRESQAEQEEPQEGKRSEETAEPTAGRSHVREPFPRRIEASQMEARRLEDATQTFDFGQDSPGLAADIMEDMFQFLSVVPLHSSRLSGSSVTHCKGDARRSRGPAAERMRLSYSTQDEKHATHRQGPSADSAPSLGGSSRMSVASAAKSADSASASLNRSLKGVRELLLRSVVEAAIRTHYWPVFPGRVELCASSMTVVNHAGDLPCGNSRRRKSRCAATQGSDDGASFGKLTCPAFQPFLLLRLLLSVLFCAALVFFFLCGSLLFCYIRCLSVFFAIIAVLAVIFLFHFVVFCLVFFPLFFYVLF